MLIASQKPNASYVAGFRTWNQLGRFVKKGEKGILILAPIVRRKAENSDDDEKESSHVAGFRAAYVFDVSQTDGQQLPQIGVVHGDPREYNDGLRRFAAAQNIAIEYSEHIAPARGTSYGGHIALLPCQSSAEEFSTLVHELAHELLHRGDRREHTSRKVRETEAEATAFVVCHAIGLETGSAAADYIQLWNGYKETLTNSLTHIQQAASQMLTAARLAVYPNSTEGDSTCAKPNEDHCLTLGNLSLREQHSPLWNKVDKLRPHASRPI